MSDQPDPADKARALELSPVSRETLSRLETFVGLLLRWNRTSNLVAPSTIPQLWTRHIADSLQLLDLATDATCWLDLGSGAGFPGVVIAAALAHSPAAQVQLVESNGKKAAFLREAVRQLGLTAVVHPTRIEQLRPDTLGPVDIVTARALAPLPDLLELAEPFLRTGAQALFPKGANAAAELTLAAEHWTLDVIQVPSRTDSRGSVLLVRHARRKNALDPSA